MIAAKRLPHHSVYVVLLDPSAACHPKVIRQKPRRDPTKPCVHAGRTGLSVSERFSNHKAGKKPAWVVKKYGDRLVPELYEQLNPMPYQIAVEAEKALAEHLRRAGYTATGGH